MAWKILVSAIFIIGVIGFTMMAVPPQEKVAPQIISYIFWAMLGATLYDVWLARS